MGKQETSRTMLFPMTVSIPIVTGTVVMIALVMIVATRFQGKTPETFPLLISGVTMMVSGCASLLVTRWVKGKERFFALSGLIGVTTIMIVPLVTVVIAHWIVEKSAARLVFSYFVVYYFMYLPVGTWLLLPPKPLRGDGETKDDQSQQE